MRQKKLKVTSSLSALTGLALGNMAGAQQVASTEVPVIDTVVVHGYRESLRSSAEAKKKTDAIIDVITGEDVGKFPDTNVAESLSHLPGLSVDRQFGEGERISIHGTDPALNRAFIDGHTLATADWGGDPQDISGRTFNYTMLSPEIIGTAKVYKSPEAWIDEGSLGGTVLIETRKPLDLQPNTLRGSGGYEYNDRSKKGNPRGSILYSWHNADSDFGALVGINYEKMNRYRAGIEYFGYAHGSDLSIDPTSTINGQPANPSSIAELGAARMPCCINFAYFDQTRERTSFNTAIQWRPDENTEFTLTGLKVKGNFTNFSQSEYTVATWGEHATNISVANGLVTGASLSGTGYVGFNPNNPTGFTHYNTSAQLDNNLRRSDVTTDSINLAGKWELGAWKVTGNLGLTGARGGKDPEYLTSFQYGGGYDFGFSQTSTFQNYAQNPADPTTFFKSDLRQGTINGVPGYYTQIGGIQWEIYRDKEQYAQVDFAREIDNFFFNKVLFGFKESNHNNSTAAHGSNVYLTAPTDLSHYKYVLSPAGLWDGLGATGNATQFATLTRDGVVSLLQSGIYSDNGENYGTEFSVNETVQAGYLQGNFAVGKLHGNIGTRVVHTRDQSDYWENNLVTDPVTGNTTGIWSPRTVTQNSTKNLPSLNLVYDVTPDFLLKAGAAKVIARPRYGQLAGAFNLDNNKLTGSGGNPNLKPYESKNFELSAEYYWSKGDMVSAELFYRDISSYVVQNTQLESLFNTARQAYTQYFVSSPFNAQNAKVLGYDLQGQYEIGWGFGIAANATIAHATVPHDDPKNVYYLPYLSKLTYNVVPYFERGPVQVRLSYGYRDKYFTQIGRLASTDYTDRYRELDFSAQYDITKMFSVYAKALNLLDETYYSFSSVTIAPTNFYKNGRQFMVGGSFKME
jgi:iron complex outermembrane recepter protein